MDKQTTKPPQDVLDAIDEVLCYATDQVEVGYDDEIMEPICKVSDWLNSLGQAGVIVGPYNPGTRARKK